MRKIIKNCSWSINFRFLNNTQRVHQIPKISVINLQRKESTLFGQNKKILSILNFSNNTGKFSLQKKLEDIIKSSFNLPNHFLQEHLINAEVIIKKWWFLTSPSIKSLNIWTKKSLKLTRNIPSLLTKLKLNIPLNLNMNKPIKIRKPKNFSRLKLLIRLKLLKKM